MRLAIAAILFGVVLVAIGTTLTTGERHPQCWEDSALVWDGATDAHTRCVPLDNITGGQP